MNLHNIDRRMGKNDKEIINTFISVGLIRIRKDIKCNSCNQIMKTDTTKGCFRFRYICNKKSHKKAVILNPFDRTIFYKSKSKIKDFIILLFQYLRREYDILLVAKCSEFYLRCMLPFIFFKLHINHSLLLLTLNKNWINPLIVTNRLQPSQRPAADAT